MHYTVAKTRKTSHLTYVSVIHKLDQLVIIMLFKLEEYARKKSTQSIPTFKDSQLRIEVSI